VKPNGWLIIDHYTYNLSEFTKSALLLRMFLRRLPPAEGLKWTDRLVNIFFPLHRAVRKHRIMQALLSRFSPILSYYHALPLTDELQCEWSFLDTHDSLTDWYKHFRTKGQISPLSSQRRLRASTSLTWQPTSGSWSGRLEHSARFTQRYYN
jgi:hypothetical protein